MKIKKDLYELLSTLLVNVEPLVDKTKADTNEIKLNVIRSKEKIKELKEILEEQDYNSSSKFLQKKLFNLFSI